MTLSPALLALSTIRVHGDAALLAPAFTTLATLCEMTTPGQTTTVRDLVTHTGLPASVIRGQLFGLGSHLITWTRADVLTVTPEGREHADAHTAGRLTFTS